MQITQEAIDIESYIKNTWKNLETKIEVKLNKIFPEPANKGLRHIWAHGSADVVVYRDGKPICIVEPGGFAHFQDEKQMKNDRRKWKLCDINGVRCFRLANGVAFGLSKRQRRKMFGKYLYKQPMLKSDKT